MRRLIGSVANAVGTALGATSRLLFLGAIITMSARSGGIPGDTIPDLQGLVCPITVETGAQFHDLPDGFVAHDYREGDGQFSFPQVNIRAANASHERAHESSARLDVWQGQFS